MTGSQAIVHCVRIGHWLSSVGHGASDGKQLPHDGVPPTEQMSRLEDDWAWAMSANAQSHSVTPGSGYSQYSHWGNRPAASVAKQTDKQAAKLYSLDMH